jgi:hypothetical protein
MATVLRFDATTRQSSRRQVEQTEAAAARIRQHEAAERSETRKLAKALNASEAELKANGYALYYHGRDVLAVEAAYKASAATGRAALLKALFEYYEMGYASGVDDAAGVVAGGSR